MKNHSDPKKHHFVTSSYLASWSNDGTKDGMLVNLDKSTAQERLSKPDNSAYIKHLYRIDTAKTDGSVHAMELENFWQKIESQAMPTIKKCMSTGTMPEEKQLDSVLDFICIHVVRVPDNIKKIEKISKQPVQLMVEKLIADGQVPDIFANLYKTGCIDINIKQNVKLAGITTGIPLLLDSLKSREWNLCQVDEGASDLICSDNPVVLHWLKPNAGYSPGFDMENTGVFFPLGPRLAIQGMWDKKLFLNSISNDVASMFNSAQIGQATRFIYAKDEFTAMSKDRTLDAKDMVLEKLAKKLSTNN